MMDILQVLLALLMIGIAYQIIGLIFGVINFIIITFYIIRWGNS